MSRLEGIEVPYFELGPQLSLDDGQAVDLVGAFVDLGEAGVPGGLLRVGRRGCLPLRLGFQSVMLRAFLTKAISLS